MKMGSQEDQKGFQAHLLWVSYSAKHGSAKEFKENSKLYLATCILGNFN